MSLPPVASQRPPMQLAAGPQSVPQLPQLRESDVRSTQAPPHIVHDEPSVVAASRPASAVPIGESQETPLATKSTVVSQDQGEKPARAALIFVTSD